MKPGLSPAVVLIWASSAAAQAFAEPTVLQAYEAWDSSCREIGERIPPSGSLRTAFDEARRKSSVLAVIARRMKERAPDLETAEFHVRFALKEYEAAAREARRLGEERDRRFEELMAGANLQRDAALKDLASSKEKLELRLEELRGEVGRVDAWNDRLRAWYERLERRRAEVDAMPKDEANYPAYLSAHAKLQGDIDDYNADREQYLEVKATYGQRAEKYSIDSAAHDARVDEAREAWEKSLVSIEAFMREQGRPVLEAQETASRKERELREREKRAQDLAAGQQQDSSALAEFLADATSSLDAVRSGLKASAEPVSAVQSRSWTEVPAGGTALRVPAAGIEDGSSRVPGAGAEVLMIPPANGDRAARLRLELEAQALAGALRRESSRVDEPAITVADAAVPPATGRDTLAPATVAPGSYHAWNSAEVVVLTEAALNRVFDPGILISDSQYTGARAELARMSSVIPKLEAQLARMQAERGNLETWTQEFESLRAELAIGAMRDVLAVYAAGMKHLNSRTKGVPASQGDLERLERAFEVVRNGLAPLHADATPEERQRRNLEFKAIEEGLATLTDIGASMSGSPGVRAFLETSGHMMKGYCEVQRFLDDPARKAPTWEKIGAALKSGIEVTGSFVPLVALASSIGSAGERGAQWALSSQAVDDLTRAATTVDDAIVCLGGQLQYARIRAEEARRTVENFERAHGGRRRATRIRPPTEVPAPR